MVNRIQNIRKDNNFEVTDKIIIEIEKNDALVDVIDSNNAYICSETLALSLNVTDKIEPTNRVVVDLADDFQAAISVRRIN